jgi:glycerol-3-phosphate dehydrogenase
MNLGVIGGGINGVMSAWILAQAGHHVTLFERDELMAATSSRSTKLLHGGLRYLEHGHLGLVREALRERRWWIEQAPHLAHPIQLLVPIYRRSRRRPLKVRLGLSLYDWLAGTEGLGRHRWHNHQEVLKLCPQLRRDDLMGGFTFVDGQMDDRALGLWAANQAREAGVTILTHSLVDRIETGGKLVSEGKLYQFHVVVNVAGPWAKQLLDRSGIATAYDLDLVRGSHLLLNVTIDCGCLVEVPGEERICFVLPYQGKTLVGTTEVRQGLEQPITCSGQEQDYLLNVYNTQFLPKVDERHIASDFAGVRPLIRSHRDPSRTSREYVIERSGSLVNVFGGKWTTARALAKKVLAVVSRSVPLQHDLKRSRDGIY